MPASRLPRISTVIESIPVPNEICGRIGRPALAVSTDSAPDSSATASANPKIPARSQGPADADLLRSFADDDQHDVADPYQSGQQRADPDDPGQRADSAEQRVELVDLFAEVLRVDRFRIVRRYGVSCEDQLFDIRFHLFDVGIVVCGDRHRV